MLARIRKSMQEKDSGFTLIELLVVMIIIGILAAIAIPVFLNQRKKAVDSSIKSDLRTVANEVETAFTDAQIYPATTNNGTGTTQTAATVTVGNPVTLSKNNVITYTPNAAGTAYCIVGNNAGASHAWVYVSSKAGLQSSVVLVCPASY
jgi:type IV pilus assembly protein PilA